MRLSVQVAKMPSAFENLELGFEFGAEGFVLVGVADKGFDRGGVPLVGEADAAPCLMRAKTYYFFARKT